jgi:hypothetical protein
LSCDKIKVFAEVSRRKIGKCKAGDRVEVNLMQGKNGAAQHLSEESVAQVAQAYITETFGAAFSIHSLQPIDANWWVRIQCQHPASSEPRLVGNLRVDGVRGEVIPLTPSGISDIRQRILLFIARDKHELARDERGYILPLQAKIKATGYVTDYIAFFATAEDQPVLIEGKPPLWRVAFVLRLHGHGKVCDLGFVDVNALTGEVLTLSEKEITTRQNRARHAAEAVTRSAAATS